MKTTCPHCQQEHEIKQIFFPKEEYIDLMSTGLAIGNFGMVIVNSVQTENRNEVKAKK